MAAQFLIAFSVILAAASADKVRPCDCISNECVGEYFAKNAWCDASLTGASDLSSYHVPYVFINDPFFNITVERSLNIIGLADASTVDFFYNKASKRAVLTTYFPYFETIGEANVNFLVTGDEPKSIPSKIRFIYCNITLTTIFNNYKKLSLADSFTFADVPVEPTYKMGDEYKEAAKTDDQIAFFLKTLKALPLVRTMEDIAFMGPKFAEIYINNKICNFQWYN